jgi:soluble lytic murein transglycosylase
MLHAYSRLVDADLNRASKAIVESRQRARLKPFSFEKPPEFDAPEFQRALELLRVGEIELAKRELEVLGVGKKRGHTGLLWGVALLYARAGAVKTSHNITRGLLTDWLGYWPAGDWVKAWQLAFPRPYEKVVQREAKRYALPEAWIYGVMREESAFDRFAVSHANAHGLMQLIVPTAKMYAKKRGLPYDARSLKRPEVNIALGASALSDLTERFAKTNPLLAIPGYNAGPGRPARWVRERPHMDFDVWVELIPFRETRRYTKRVLASRAAYAALYDPDFAEQAMTLPLKVAP